MCARTSATTDERRSACSCCDRAAQSNHAGKDADVDADDEDDDDADVNADATEGSVKDDMADAEDCPMAAFAESSNSWQNSPPKPIHDEEDEDDEALPVPTSAAIEAVRND